MTQPNEVSPFASCDWRINEQGRAEMLCPWCGHWVPATTCDGRRIVAVHIANTSFCEAGGRLIPSGLGGQP